MSRSIDTVGSPASILATRDWPDRSRRATSNHSSIARSFYAQLKHGYAQLTSLCASMKVRQIQILKTTVDRMTFWGTAFIRHEGKGRVIGWFMVLFAALYALYYVLLRLRLAVRG